MGDEGREGSKISKMGDVIYRRTMLYIFLFFQNLLAMTAQDWKSVINATSDLNEDWVHYKQIEFELNLHEMWYYDQWITTLGLLKSQICNVPSYSGLWNNKNVEFDPNFDDSEQCWHGFGFKDCNIEMHIGK